jgi:hypothetical protein
MYGRCFSSVCGTHRSCGCIPLCDGGCGVQLGANWGLLPIGWQLQLAQAVQVVQYLVWACLRPMTGTPAAMAWYSLHLCVTTFMVYLDSCVGDWLVSWCHPSGQLVQEIKAPTWGPTAYRGAVGRCQHDSILCVAVAVVAR